MWNSLGLGVLSYDKRTQKVLMNFRIIISFKLMFGTSPAGQVLLLVLRAWRNANVCLL